MRKILSIIAFTGSIVVLYVLGIAIHLVSAFIIFLWHGILLGFISFGFPGVTTIYVFIKNWIMTGTPFSIFGTACIVFLFIQIIAIGASHLLDKYYPDF